MARASISFQDAEEGVLMTLNFDDELPEDPADATEAQVQAMIAFQAFMSWTHEGQDEVELDLNENGDGFDLPYPGDDDFAPEADSVPEV